MQKIYFLLLHLGFGGIETSTINTCNALCDSFDIELIVFYKIDFDLREKLDKRIKVKYLYNGKPNKEEFRNAIKNKKVIKIFKEGIKATSIIYKKKKLMINEIKSIKSGIIVSTRMEFSILLSKYGNKKVIKIAQEHQHHNNNRKYINVIKNKYVNLNYLFSLTSSLEKDYIRILKNRSVKVFLVPNMILESKNEVSKLNSKTIISVGRFNKIKRINLLLEVLKRTENDIKLILVGDGEEKEKIIKQIKKSGLEKRVKLTGMLYKEEVEKQLIKSSIFILTSRSEGLPMVILEAMDKGLPCIAFETKSGVSDIIINNKNGYIIKNDNIEEMAKKIDELINNKALLKKFSIEAKKTVKNFSVNNIKKKWINILKYNN